MNNGIEQGEKSTQIEIAKNLLKLKIPIDKITEATKLPKKEIERFKNNKNI